MRVVSLWRYPVKSMQGEQLETASIGDLGIVGDRQWALVDLGTGLALTARRVPELLFAGARLVGDPRRPTSRSSCPTARSRPTTPRCRPGSAATSSCAGPAAASPGATRSPPTSRTRPGRSGSSGTARTARSTTPGRARVSVLGTGSIGEWDRRRFRGNVVVEADGVGAENELVGQRVTRRLGGARRGQADRPLRDDDPPAAGRHRARPRRAAHDQRRAATHLGVGALVLQAGAVDRRRRGLACRPGAWPLSSDERGQPLADVGPGQPVARASQTGRRPARACAGRGSRCPSPRDRPRSAGTRRRGCRGRAARRPRGPATAGRSGAWRRPGRTARRHGRPTSAR